MDTEGGYDCLSSQSTRDPTTVTTLPTAHNNDATPHSTSTSAASEMTNTASASTIQGHGVATSTNDYNGSLSNTEV